jgi:hypothetical protein
MRGNYPPCHYLVKINGSRSSFPFGLLRRRPSQSPVWHLSPEPTSSLAPFATGTDGYLPLPSEPLGTFLPPGTSLCCLSCAACLPPSLAVLGSCCSPSTSAVNGAGIPPWPTSLRRQRRVAPPRWRRRWDPAVARLTPPSAPHGTTSLCHRCHWNPIMACLPPPSPVLGSRRGSPPSTAGAAQPCLPHRRRC